MSRRKTAKKRDVLIDYKFKSKTITKFINHIMMSGKKTIAEKIVYGALNKIEEQQKSPALDLFKKSLSLVTPIVEVKARRIGGTTYQVPVEVRPERGRTLAMRWIIEGAKKRKDKSMISKISQEIIDTLMGKSSSIKKREEIHKMAEANKAFSHFRW